MEILSWTCENSSRGCQKSYHKSSSSLWQKFCASKHKSKAAGLNSSLRGNFTTEFLPVVKRASVCWRQEESPKRPVSRCQSATSAPRSEHGNEFRATFALPCLCRIVTGMARTICKQETRGFLSSLHCLVNSMTPRIPETIAKHRLIVIAFHLQRKDLSSNK